jgi:hypothetical protein
MTESTARMSPRGSRRLLIDFYQYCVFSATSYVPDTFREFARVCYLGGVKPKHVNLPKRRIKACVNYVFSMYKVVVR